MKKEQQFFGDLKLVGGVYGHRDACGRGVGSGGRPPAEEDQGQGAFIGNGGGAEVGAEGLGDRIGIRGGLQEDAVKITGANGEGAEGDFKHGGGVRLGVCGVAPRCCGNPQTEAADEVDW